MRYNEYYEIQFISQMIKMIVTFFYTGCSKFMPGTIGSLATCLFIYPFINSRILLFCGWFFASTVGSYCVYLYTKNTTQKDPKEVVIDETLGILTCFLLLKITKRNIIFSDVIIGFILFRIFDIFKPFPISFFDKQKNVFGVMMDDCLAGFFAFLFLQYLTL